MLKAKLKINKRKQNDRMPDMGSIKIMRKQFLNGEFSPFHFLHNLVRGHVVSTGTFAQFLSNFTNS